MTCNLDKIISLFVEQLENNIGYIQFRFSQ